MDCVFCKIISGEIPAEKIYEDSDSLAILDINPNNTGHTLVIPKIHKPNFLDTDTNLLSHLFTVVKKVCLAQKSTLGATGFNITTNNGKDAGQTVEHLHFHVIPRFAKDNLPPWPQKNYKDDEMVNIANKLRNFIDN